MTPADPTPDRAEPAASEPRRVQVVARWNSWVQVYDPADGSVRWVDLAEADHRPS